MILEQNKCLFLPLTKTSVKHAEGVLMQLTNVGVRYAWVIGGVPIHISFPGAVNNYCFSVDRETI